METSRFLRIREIFDQATALPMDQVPAFVEEACAGDGSLKAEVVELLRAHYQAGGTFGGATTQPPRPAGSTTTPLAASSRIGPYRLVRELGRGGMGVVWLAMREDGAFRKAVALKLLATGGLNPGFLERFQRERQILANLDHPNIARILDGGDTTDGAPYYVMEFVEGVPLDRYCDENRLTLPDRVRLFQQICAAVHYLHQNGVIHRDLKPGNILVAPGPRAKLLDFGIARVNTPADGGLTAPQERLLTPNYASPEQYTGAPCTAASDIYTLGVILYLLLTGRLPGGPDPTAPSGNIREDLQRTPETTQQLRKRLIGDLDAVVLKALSRDPARRYATAAEFTEDLQRFLDGEPVLARRASWAERAGRAVLRYRVAAGIAVLVVALGSYGVWATLSRRASEQRAAAAETRLRSSLDQLRTPDAATLETGNVQQMISDIRRLRVSLETDLPAASQSAAGAAAHGQLLDRATRYLDSVAPASRTNPSLAAELGRTYLTVASTLSSPRNGTPQREHALRTYAKAGYYLRQAAASNPGDTALGPRIAQADNGITSLGGQVDTLVGEVARSAAPPAPVEPAPGPEQPSPVQPSPSRPAAPSKARTSPASYEPARPAQQAPAVPPELRDRFISVSAKVRTAQSLFDKMKSDLAARGLSLHPNILSSQQQMSVYLDLAQSQLKSGDFTGASDSLARVDAFASRILKEGGR
jgi:predicted Ser/Thr protein kinase